MTRIFKSHPVVDEHLSNLCQSRVVVFCFAAVPVDLTTPKHCQQLLGLIVTLNSICPAQSDEQHVPAMSCPTVEMVSFMSGQTTWSPMLKLALSRV